MKKIIIAMAAMAAAFSMVSCSKEQLVEPENNTNPIEGNCIITASTESNLTKTSLEGDDENGYEVVWSEGDSFKIGGNTFTLTTGDGTTNGTFKGDAPADGNYTVYYPSTYNGSTWPVSQTYSEGNITGSPMKAEVTITDGKSSESIKFKNEGGILRLTVKGTATVTGIQVSATGLSEAITLDCGDGVELDNTDGTVFHIAMPAGSYSKTSIQFTTASGSYCTKTLKLSTLDITRSKITPATFSTSFITTGSAEPLPGMFTVANGRLVSFSQGNLICDISDENAPKWGFYEKQYGYATGYSSTLISLFTWGYHPTESLYPGSGINNTIYHLEGNYLPQDKDWGSRIGDGKTWRTLTGEEWKYLFEERVNAADKYGFATVCGVNGLVILPDEFTDPMKNGGSGAFVPKSTTEWDANVYATGGDWEAMEAAGAVFFPAAGNRDCSTVNEIGSTGRYWSSSIKPNSNPYFLYFNNTLADSNRYGDVSYGRSVRLVTDLYTVSFDMNGKTCTAPESLKGIPYGSTITMPSNPSAEGYAFKGWYKNMACTDKWNFETDKVTANTTLYAGWIELPDGALPGLFTVNSSGKQVFFSKGNLWYGKTSEEAESATFNFETNQYDVTMKYDIYVGDNVRDDGHISHFMWSKNANVSLAVDYNDPSASNNDVFFTNATQTTPNPNFTVNGQKEVWRALSAEESSYLFNNHKHVWATINGVGGIIVFCDGYSGVTEGEFTEIPKGCLFLPAAGWRIGVILTTSRNTSRIYKYGKDGSYLTSTNDEYSDNWATSIVRVLEFATDIFDPDHIAWRAHANPVRLVTDVK